MQIVLFITAVSVLLITAYLYYYGRNLFSDELNKPLGDAQQRVQDELFAHFALQQSQKTKNLNSDDEASTEKTSDFYLFNNITLPLEGSFIKADHLLITSHGIFLLDNIQCSGRIRYSKNSGFTQEINGEIANFHTPVLHPGGITAKLGEFLPELDLRQIHYLMVFSGECHFASIMPPHVVKLETLVKRISSHAPAVSYQQLLQIVGQVTSNRIDTRRHDQLKRDNSVNF